MKLATIAILLGVVVVTILATTAAHATSKNNPAIEACFNKSDLIGTPRLIELSYHWQQSRCWK